MCFPAPILVQPLFREHPPRGRVGGKQFDGVGEQRLCVGPLLSLPMELGRLDEQAVIVRDQLQRRLVVAGCLFVLPYC